MIAKHHYSAFHDTGLTDHLKARGIRTVAVTGVATNVCVESTLRDAFFDGFHVVVPRDCVGADDPDLHHASLRTVDSYFGYVTDADTLIALMGNARKETAPTGI